MDQLDRLPETAIQDAGPVSKHLLSLGVRSFHDACRYVRALPYGYNADRDDPWSLFREGKGSCTTKHAVIAILADELSLPVGKTIGIYPMNEALVTGTGRILAKYGLPYVPMVHCFLAYGTHRVDLTEGNRNGKNGPVDKFLFVRPVKATIGGKEEYLLYRRALTEYILQLEELNGVDIRTILHAREEAVALLRQNIEYKHV